MSNPARMLLFLTAITGLLACVYAADKPAAPDAAPAKDPAKTSINLRLLDAEDKAGATAIGQPGGAAVLKITRGYEKGDQIVVIGTSHMFVRLDEAMPEALVYCPDGVLQFPIPFGADAKAFPPLTVAAHTVSARVATRDDLAKYRNLALNPVDVSAAGEAFPHATANSVCRGEPVFAARNAIDGSVDADGHGDWPHQSWGPDQKDDLVWRVDFGRTVEIDKVVVALRAHVGHDKFWKGATLVLSDGTKKAVTFEPNGNPRTFALPATKVTWVELRDFTWPEPRGWCAITEVEVWGRDVEPKP